MGSEGSRLEALMKSYKSEVAITELLFTPTRKQSRLSPESDALVSRQQLTLKRRLASAGTLGERGRGGPRAQVLTPDN